MTRLIPPISLRFLYTGLLPAPGCRSQLVSVGTKARLDCMVQPRGIKVLVEEYCLALRNQVNTVLDVIAAPPPQATGGGR